MTTQPQAEARGEGHERKDADVTSIALVGLALLLVILLVQLTVWMTVRHLHLERAAKDHGGESTAQSAGLFPGPRLQIDPGVDLATMRVRDARELNTYGWIDRQAGLVRIPIERAMQLIAERGLPDVGQNQTPLRLMQARPAAKPAPKKRRVRY
jgi:hypothetical protein